MADHYHNPAEDIELLREQTEKMKEALEYYRTNSACQVTDTQPKPKEAGPIEKRFLLFFCLLLAC
jgi:hypothetical protein